MENFINYSIFIIGIYFIIFSFIMKTKNLLSGFIFKIFPFFSGLICVFNSLKLLNII